MDAESSLYSVLGVSSTATDKEITSAYRAKARTEHPDKGGDAAAWHGIAEAYEVLGDVTKRAIYDETGEVPKRKPSIEDKAREVILMMFMELVPLLKDAAHDLAEMLRDRVRAKRNDVRRQMKGLENAREAFTASLGRLQGSESDVVDGFLNQQLAAMASETARLEAELALMERADEMIADLKDVRAQVPPPRDGLWGSHRIRIPGYRFEDFANVEA